MQLESTLKPYRGAYKPENPNPYLISRSKIELFIECPRCFYLDRRLGIERPRGFPFNLNKAVDTLLKKEFDAHRAKESSHPLMESYNVDAIPFLHDQINNWRENFIGVQTHHKPTNFLVFGAVDDIWQHPNGELAVVDYKATSKKGEVSLDAPWQVTYKRQLEVYQWLLRQNDFPVSDTGYFVYANGRADARAFDAKLEFDVKVIAYTGKDDWIEPALEKVKQCLTSDETPPPSHACEYCRYARARITKQV